MKQTEILTHATKRLVPSRLHELHEPKFLFVSRIEFIRLKLSNFSAHVYGVSEPMARLKKTPGEGEDAGVTLNLRRCIIVKTCAGVALSENLRR